MATILKYWCCRSRPAPAPRQAARACRRRGARFVCLVPHPLFDSRYCFRGPTTPAVLIASQPYNKPSVATQRRPESSGIILDSGVKQMVLPGPVDAQIAARIALALEARFFKQTDRSGIGRYAGRLQPMQPQRAEAERNQGAHRRRHVAFAGKRRADPIADAAGLGDAAADIGERQPADQRIVIAAKDQEGISEIAACILGVALEPPAERAACEIVRRPSRLPRHEKGAAGFAQRRPFGMVAALRRAQRDAGTGNGRHGFVDAYGAEKRHGQYANALPSGSGAADQTFSDRSRAFKTIAGPERGDRRLATSDQRAAGSARAGDRYRVDFGDDLVERDRPAIRQHLPGNLPQARLRTLQSHQQAGFHL